MSVRKLLETIFVIISLWSPSSIAAISIDRTRVIFNETDKFVTVKLANESLSKPYLAQSWLEREDGTRKGIPLLISPPLQRINPEKQSIIKINTLPEITRLPQDRESVFYLNVKEVPPVGEQSNRLHLALQSKIKLFYRPSSVASPGKHWDHGLVLYVTQSGYRIENTTPYYATVISIREDQSSNSSKRFRPVMIAPKASQEVESDHYIKPILRTINDYGGKPEAVFVCQNNVCRVS